MNPRLSAAIQAFTPPIVWNALQRRRGRAGIFPWREFGFMATWANAEPLLEGKFAALYAKYGPLDPISPPEKNLFRNYNLCCFANLCREAPGDFVCAGVSWGVMPRIVFDFVDLASLGKVLHLIDPFEGTIASTGGHAHTFNSDPDYVLRQYPQSAPIKLHRTTIPLRLPQKLAFVFTDTGDPAADAAALPIFFEGLSPGGIFITEQYANNIEYYAPVLAQLRVSQLFRGFFLFVEAILVIWYESERHKGRWPSQRLRKSPAEGRPSRITSSLRNAVADALRERKRAVADLRRDLIALGRTDVPSADTLERLIDQLSGDRPTRIFPK